MEVLGGCDCSELYEYIWTGSPEAEIPEEDPAVVKGQQARGQHSCRVPSDCSNVNVDDKRAAARPKRVSGGAKKKEIS